MKRIKVTGYMYVNDEQTDTGPLGPLNEDTFLEVSNSLGLDDVEFEFAEEDN
jgi:hypothetical protein